MVMVYEPQEDSHLLAEVVAKRVKPKMHVLDMGTGSGIQAFSATKAGARIVMAVDVDEQALDHVTQQIKEKNILNIRVQQSDLFSNIGEHDLFDIIIFNAPYLPDDVNDPDIALDGGVQGHELITKFLAQAKNHLLPNGEILLLFSTQTGFEQVLEAINDNEFIAEQLAEYPMFFERLYVYSLTKLP